MTPVRVLLADDHALVRAGIRALLEGLEGVVVVAEAGNGGEVLELASSVPFSPPPPGYMAGEGTM